MESILVSIKKMLGIEAEYKQFDLDIITHINSVFMILTQLGIGPKGGFSIEDDTSLWTDFVPEVNRVEAIRSYIFLKVRLMFDPPYSTAVISAIERQLSEFEWRINEERTISEAEGSSSAALDMEEIRLLIDAALKLAIQNGELTAIQGPPGKDGKDGEDGEDGVSPHIGDNGNWYVGDTDTGVHASGSGSSSGLFAMTVDDDGNLYLHYEEGSVTPEFELDDSGNLYYLIEE